MNVKQVITLIAAGAIGSSAPSLAQRDLLVVPAVLQINGWKVVCYDLEASNTSCSAEHRDASPYLYLQFWRDKISVAASSDCTHDGYAPKLSVSRERKRMSKLIGEVLERLATPLKACAGDPLHGLFGNDFDDVLSLLIRTTAAPH